MGKGLNVLTAVYVKRHAVQVQSSAQAQRLLLIIQSVITVADAVKSCPTDAWEGKSGYIVSFGGLFGNHIYKGETILPLITDEDTLFRVTDAAIGFFEKNANPGERFRLLLQRVGEDEFRKEIQAAYKGQE